MLISPIFQMCELGQVTMALMNIQAGMSLVEVMWILGKGSS